MNYYIKASEWEEIFTKLRMIKKIHTKDELALRQFIEGVWYIARKGPVNGGYYLSIMGIGELFICVSIHKEADKTEVMIDATIVRSHACSAGYKKDSQQQESIRQKQRRIHY